MAATYPASGPFSLSAIAASNYITGPLSMSNTRGWSGTSNMGSISFSSFLNKPARTRYPPPQIGAGSTWTKDGTDTIVGIDQTYRKYKFTVSTAAYGNGMYVAYANSIYSYLNGAGYNSDEWPPSGLFDYLLGQSSAKQGWHAHANVYTSTTDNPNPGQLYVQLPTAITLRTYTLQCRSDCCTVQPPSKWDLHGSTDGTTWILIQSKTDSTSWALSQTKTYQVTNNTQKYKYYRLTIYRNSNASSDFCHIGEWGLFGAEYV